MMKIFLVLFISFAYAAKSLELKDETIKRASTSRFDQLDSNTFYCIMTFLSAEEVLNLKILNRKTYHRVRNLWPEMELSTVVDNSWPGRPVDFSHIVEVHRMNVESGYQIPFYNRAQLSCVRKFSLSYSNVRGLQDLQAIIDLLPKDSLTSLIFYKFDPLRSLISKIDFPKLTHLKLGMNIGFGCDIFSFLPNCMKALEMSYICMDDIASSLLATALKNMNGLDFLSLYYCILPEDSFSTILENLPAFLRRLDISNIKLLDSVNKLSELPGLKRLKEMEYLQEIDFRGVNSGFALEIISNLPKSITSILCTMNRENVDAFKRLGEFMNIKRINLDFVDHNKFYLNIQEIFPNLDEDIKRELDKNNSKTFK